jgi:hypothetical protein
MRNANRLEALSLPTFLSQSKYRIDRYPAHNLSSMAYSLSLPKWTEICSLVYLSRL